MKVNWDKWNSYNRLPWWKKFIFLFCRTKTVWNHEEIMVTKYKELNGKIYILKQERILHGDQRNAQIDRMGAV